MCRMVNRDLSFIPVMKDGEAIGVVRTVEILGELSPICGGRLEPTSSASEHPKA
jgi:hypothetical protein